MAKLTIQTGADNPILRTVSKPVKVFDSGLKKLVKDMKQTMVAAKGLGLAAPQVGVNKRVFLITLDYGKKGEKVLVMVNPKIRFLDDGDGAFEMIVDEEGCLSLPGIWAKVERYRHIEVTFYDESGTHQILQLSDLNAREVQHENDHLDAVLFTDKLVG